MTDDILAEDQADRDLFLEMTAELLKVPGVPGFQQAYEVIGTGTPKKSRDLK